MNFYKRYLGDYARDTAHLSLMEHGVYTVLLDTYYATGGVLPQSKDELYRIARAMTAPERKAVDRVADQFFAVNGDGTRHNKRADAELASAAAYADAQSMRAHKRWHMPAHERTQCPADASHSHSQKDLTPNPREPGGSPSEPAVPDCPQQAILALYAKHLPTLTQPRLWEGARAELLRVRWRHCAKANDVWSGYTTQAEGLAFWERFFAGVAASRKLTEGIPRGDGSTWKPDLPWLLKAENFTKVIERKYHE